MPECLALKTCMLTVIPFMSPDIKESGCSLNSIHIYLVYIVDSDILYSPASASIIVMGGMISKVLQCTRIKYTIG